MEEEAGIGLPGTIQRWTWRRYIPRTGESVTQSLPTTSRSYELTVSATRLDANTGEAVDEPVTHRVRVVVSRSSYPIPEPVPRTSPSILPGPWVVDPVTDRVSSSGGQGQFILDGAASVVGVYPPSTRLTYQWTVAILPEQSISRWEDVDAASNLDRLKLVLGVLPDEEPMQTMERQCDKGRDMDPARPVWNAILAGVVFQHPSIASLRRDLCRNAELRALCGFNPSAGLHAVPTDSAFSNFLGNLLEHEPMIRQMFHALLCPATRFLL